MNRTLIQTAGALALGLALFATSANAMDIKLDVAGKSAAELQLVVKDAAFKACAATYAGDYFADYKRDGCVAETVKTTLARAAALSNTASIKTTRRETVLASR